MQPGNWPNPPGPDEYALRCDRGRATRLLIVPALFDEGHKLRRFTVETMRALDTKGIDTMLPDLPGLNESHAELAHQTLRSWHAAIVAAAAQFHATDILSIRAGASLLPDGYPAIRYAPIGAEHALRALLRSRVIADREAGRDSSREALLASGKRDGLRLAGYALGPQMVVDLAEASLKPADTPDIAQSDLGGPALWLRAEAASDPAQVEALAAKIVEALR
ncbi:MAG: hypothetical protein WBA68_09140 [Alteraurantiacibacter sp.]